MTPLPKISAAKYDPLPARPARVRVRVKGSNSEGILFQGQYAIGPCYNCGPAVKPH